METKWKDVIGMYLGCDVLFDNKVWEFCGIRPEDIVLRHRTLKDDFGLFQRVKIGFVDFKPILRPLNDMSKAEESEYWEIRGTGWTSDTEQQMLREATGTKYLLSKSFDLFSLIPSGQALDRTTLPSLTNNKI